MIGTITRPTCNAAARERLIEELSQVEGKAEIVNGRIVLISPAGDGHGHASLNIAFSLKLHEKQYGGGRAFGDNNGFVVNLPNRDSFSPDAGWRTQALNREFFVQGAPAFAVEIRSMRDYSPAGERAVLSKIREYFAAGTLVVWDVDFLNDGWIKKFTPDSIDSPRIFKRGENADAEPAVQGWRMAVNDLF